jgi:hypothetical protein
MLSIKNCKKLMTANPSLEDREIESLRDSLYGLAHVVVERFKSGATPSTTEIQQLKREDATFSEIVDNLPEDERNIVEERAAIMQFDGGCDRQTAEHYALRDYWNGILSGGKDAQ